MRSFCISSLLIRSAAMLAVSAGLIVAQTQNDSVSACNWIAKPELSQVLGAPVSDGRSLVGGKGVSVCWFALRGGGRVSILVRTPVSPDWTAAESARMRRGAAYRPARIQGDQAFLYGTRDAGATACVFSDGVYLQVSVSGIGNSSVLAERLGDQIAGRIESARQNRGRLMPVAAGFQPARR